MSVRAEWYDWHRAVRTARRNMKKQDAVMRGMIKMGWLHRTHPLWQRHNDLMINPPLYHHYRFGYYSS